MKITTAYVAGFTDGEGYIGIVGRGPRITLGQKPREVLDAIQQWLTRLGIVSYLYYRPPAPDKRRPNGLYTLNVSARQDVRTICETLLPYLIVKKQHALKVLQWMKDNPSKSHRGPIDVDSVRTLILQGLSHRMVAKQLGCKSGLIWKIAKRHGIKINHYAWKTVNGERIPVMTKSEYLEHRRQKYTTGKCKDCGKPCYFDSITCRQCAGKRRFGKPHPVQLKNGWSRNYERCISCGTSKIRHVSKGRCSQCRSKERYVQTKRKTN